MGLSIGIKGFPNVGKSTLFNALLKKLIELIYKTLGLISSLNTGRFKTRAKLKKRI